MDSLNDAENNINLTAQLSLGKFDDEKLDDEKNWMKNVVVVQRRQQLNEDHSSLQVSEIAGSWRGGGCEKKTRNLIFGSLSLSSVVH